MTIGAPGRASSCRPTTLWPLGDAEPLPGTARLAGWLGRTIITLVTGYTRPGDRVLLLASPPAAPALRRRPTTPGWAQRGDSYSGLTEVVWTVIRLGRGADTVTAAPVPDYPHDTPDPSGSSDSVGLGAGLGHTESGSGRRPCPLGPRRATDRSPRQPCDRFDLIITAVSPHATDWLADTDWDTLLTPTGILAVITQSDTRAGRLIDPISTIVDTIRNQRRGWLDHIAVLDTPLPPTNAGLPTATTTGPSLPARSRPRGPNPRAPITTPPPGPLAEMPPVLPVHHDLLLFGSVPTAPSPTPVRADHAEPPSNDQGRSDD